MILVDTSKGLVGGVSQQRAAHDGVQRRAFLHINQRAGHDAFDQRDVQLFVHLDRQGSGKDGLNAIGRSAALDELLLGAVAQGEVVDDFVEFTLELVLVDLDDRLSVGAEEAQTQGSFPTWTWKKRSASSGSVLTGLLGSQVPSRLYFFATSFRVRGTIF